MVLDIRLRVCLQHYTLVVKKIWLLRVSVKTKKYLTPCPIGNISFVSLDYVFTVGAYHSTIGDDSLLFAYDIISAVFNLVNVHSFVLLLIGCVTQ